MKVSALVDGTYPVPTAFYGTLRDELDPHAFAKLRVLYRVPETRQRVLTRWKDRPGDTGAWRSVQQGGLCVTLAINTHLRVL